ncbi:MAG: hypothetical protein R3D32_02645 [Nitratireductor sp.]
MGDHTVRDADWGDSPTLLANRPYRKPGYAPYGSESASSGRVSSVQAGASRSPLRHAMREADIRMALEDMDMPDDAADVNHQGGPASGYAPQLQPSLEEMLEAEMVASQFLSQHDATQPQGMQDRENSQDDAALADLATHEVARACRDIVDDARTEAILQRISQKRREAAEILRLRALDETQSASPSSPIDAAEWQQEQQQIEREFLEPPHTHSFLSAFNARRLAYAAGMVAILAGTATAWQIGLPFKLAAPLANLAEIAPPPADAEAQPRDEAEPDVTVRPVTASASTSTPRAKTASRAASAELPTSQGEPAEPSSEAWSASLAERLGPAQTSQPAAAKQEARFEASPPSTKQVKPAPAPTSELAFASDAVVPDDTARKAIQAVNGMAMQGQPPPAPKVGPEAEPVKTASTDAAPTSQRPRPAEQVDLALASAMGLESLTATAKARLREKLVAGDCLAPALAEAFGQVPVLAMRDLVQKLDSGC